MKEERPPALRGKIIIQGGPGSFNDSALRKWIANAPQSDLTVVFAQSTAEVLLAVEEGRYEYGQFALHNSGAGFYDESLDAVGRHRFANVTSHSYPVEHALLTHSGRTARALTDIVTHAEVLKHCRGNISRLLPHISIEVGEGEYHDPSAVARGIAAGVFPPSTGTISNPALAAEWGLTIAHPAMHDRPSETTFLIVSQLDERNR